MKDFAQKLEFLPLDSQNVENDKKWFFDLKMKWNDDLAQSGVSDKHGTVHDQVLRIMTQELQYEKLQWLEWHRHEELGCKGSCKNHEGEVRIHEKGWENIVL